MANVKISGLPTASTPLTGAELVPVVQSGVTSQTTLSAMPYVPTGTGAVTTTVQAKLRETVSVKDFGAVGDGVTDDTAAIQAAIDAVNAAGGGTLYVPTGTYIVGALNMKIKVRIVGDGSRSSILKSSHTGYGLKMSSPINSSTSVNTSVESIQLWNTNASNTNGGYVDVGGTFVNLFNVQIRGFKYGVIFDQTELATIRQGDFEGNLYAGLWLVNGSEYTPGASSTFTNRINVDECQFNQSSSAYGILDEGGYAHSFTNNNYNGCSTHIYACGAVPVVITNSEFEAAAGSCIVFHNITPTGTVKGPCTTVEIDGNIIVPAAGQKPISCFSGPNQASITNNLLGSSTAAKIAVEPGNGNFATLTDTGNNNAGGTYISGAIPVYRVNESVKSVGGTNFQKVFAGKGYYGTATTVTIAFTADNANATFLADVRMIANGGVYLDLCAGRYSTGAGATELRKSASAGTTVAYSCASGVFTITITTSANNPIVTIDASLGNELATRFTANPTITFA